MDEAVMDSHVELYVNNYSLDFGADGMAAIEHLLGLAQAKGLL
jgi:1,4-dihydroxy-6-naphthoate synthase